MNLIVMAGTALLAGWFIGAMTYGAKHDLAERLAFVVGLVLIALGVAAGLSLISFIGGMVIGAPLGAWLSRAITARMRRYG